MAAGAAVGAGCLMRAEGSIAAIAATAAGERH